MDIWYIYSLVIISTIVPAVTKLLEILFDRLIHIVFHIRYTYDDSQQKTIKHYLRDRGYCAARSLRGNRTGDGLHYVQIEGYHVFVRCIFRDHNLLRVVYIYTFSKKALALVEKYMLLEAFDSVEKSYIYMRNSQVMVSTSSYKQLGAPKQWQKNVIDQILAYYDKNITASVLIYGPVGIGKSCIAEFIAIALHKQNKIPTYFCNFNPSTPGMFIDEFAIYQTEADTPVILVMDEFDSAVNIAKKAGENEKAISRNTNSHASSKAELCSLLDRLARSPNYLTIATTNQPIKDFPEAYIRQGRFHLKFKIVETSNKKYSVELVK